MVAGSDICHHAYFNQNAVYPEGKILSMID
jgi:hypothetical protein